VGKIFDITEKNLGNIIKCPHCDQKLKVNDFTADFIVIEDENMI